MVKKYYKKSPSKKKVPSKPPTNIFKELHDTPAEDFGPVPKHGKMDMGEEESPSAFKEVKTEDAEEKVNVTIEKEDIKVDRTGGTGYDENTTDRQIMEDLVGVTKELNETLQSLADFILNG